LEKLIENEIVTTPRRYKILVVDDEKFVRFTILTALRLSGNDYELLTAENGVEAVDVALKEKPDLILMDWQMPELTGIEALKVLKDNQQTKEIPVIMTTGLSGSEKLQEALDGGAVDYIRKPVDKTELLARSKSALLLYDSYLKIKNQNRQIQNQIEELEKLSLIVKETDNSVLLLKPNGEIDWVNEGFVRMYEYSHAEFCKVYGDKIFSSSETINIEEIISELNEKKKSNTYQSVIETKSGEFKWVQTRITPILDENKNIKRFIAIETDITKLKEAERELKERNKGLIKLARSLKEMNILQEKQNQEILKEKEVIENEKKALEEEKQIIENEKRILEVEKQKTEKLLLNILPENVAIQLKSSGAAKPRNYRTATVLFTDFKGFTKSCETLTPQQLVYTLHTYFARFDDIVEKHYIEKIKTIGDAYMCVGGLPIRNRSNPFDVVLAGLEIQALMRTLSENAEESGLPDWKLRLGIHTGPVVAGVVGKRKFAYDIWGDTVNIAARMEQSGEVSKVNISGETFEIVQDYFNCTYRGKIDAKNKGKIDMYFVDGIKPEYREEGVEDFIPNHKFLDFLNNM